MDPRSSSDIEQLTPQVSSDKKDVSVSETKFKVGKKQKNLVRILPILLLGFGLVAGLILVRYSAEIRNLAFSGYQSNLNSLAGLKVDPNPISSGENEPEDSARRLFNSLSRTYFDADVQNIDLPDAGIVGVVFAKYDTDINKTFIFSRIEGMPVVEGRLEQMWLVNQNLDYIPAGLGETYQEGDTRATYNVFVQDGDITTSYKQVIYSYDSSVESVSPLSPVLSVDF